MHRSNVLKWHLASQAFIEYTFETYERRCSDRSIAVVKGEKVEKIWDEKEKIWDEIMIFKVRTLKSVFSTMVHDTDYRNARGLRYRGVRKSRWHDSKGV